MQRRTNPAKPVLAASCLLVLVGALWLASLAGLITGSPSKAASPTTWDGSRPGYLVPVIDEETGNSVVRITDAGKAMYNPRNDPKLAKRVWADAAGHGYSSRVAWNADQSLLLIEKGAHGETFLDGRTYEPLFAMNMRGDVRWHPTDADLLYFITGSCVGSFSVAARGKVWQKCFEEFTSMTMSSPGKGVPSIDGNILPVRAKRLSDGHWVGFYFNVAEQKRSKVIDLMAYVVAGKPVYVMSPKTDVIIIYGCIEGHEHDDCEAQVAIDFETQAELWRDTRYHRPGHADAVIDKAGRQWRVGVSKERGPLRGHIIKRNFRTGEVVSLIPEWGSHASTRNIFDESRKVVITYGNGNRRYRGQIVSTCIDLPCPGGVELIARTYTAEKGIYLAEGQGSISPNGDKVVFRSNLGKSGGPIDAYVVELTGAK